MYAGGSGMEAAEEEMSGVGFIGKTGLAQQQA
jgi:hypothetical protein